MKNYLSLIKFSHTIFAMPFALMGFTLGYLTLSPPDYIKLLILVILCMVFARSAAMAFNRWLDRDIDAKNPRTVIREIPAGTISSKAALGFVVANVALFIATTFFINPLCFALSPVALIVILGYSYTKRFTPLCHLVLGLGLALAPVGAYIAVTGIFNVLPILLGVAVLFWVAGFDIIYALQDQDFDKANQLNSIPVMFGTNGALRISQIFHLISAISVIMVTYLLFQSFPQVSWLTLLGLTTFLGLLIYQHLLVSPNDLSKVNLAFFTTNGIASLIFGSLVMLDLYL
ncbi:MAG: UbiA family prenyltransferase [Saprospiraceae bacterium]|nr:UbiA family prenyltransferase [Saprospiraceae bacterium]